jgi:brassinosteroid-6-oxidase 1
VFRTHILGCPTVVCMEAELNRRALASEGRGFVPGYPQSMLDILGRNNIAAVQGPLHRAMRGAMLSLVRPAMIRSSLLPKIDAFMRSHLAAWSSSSSSAVVDIQAKTKEVLSLLLLLLLLLLAWISSSSFLFLLSETTTTVAVSGITICLVISSSNE